MGNKSVAAVTVASVLPWEGFEGNRQFLYFVIMLELPHHSYITGHFCIQPPRLWYNVDSFPFMFSFRQIVSELPGSRDQIKPFQDPRTSPAGQCSPPLLHPVHGAAQDGALGEILVRGRELPLHDLVPHPRAQPEHGEAELPGRASVPLQTAGIGLLSSCWVAGGEAGGLWHSPAAPARARQNCQQPEPRGAAGAGEPQQQCSVSEQTRDRDSVSSS